MANKKAAIGALIKSDMSRRVIGEELIPALVETQGEAPAEEAAPKRAAAEKPSRKIGADPESAALVEFLILQAEREGMINEEDRRNFYAFLRSQALRYLSGFSAGRRFRG